jgi:hypothetical protein
VSEIGIVTVIVAVFGALVTFTQAMALWILSDIRRRVERLETNIMEGPKK